MEENKVENVINIIKGMDVILMLIKSIVRVITNIVIIVPRATQILFFIINNHHFNISIFVIYSK